MSTETAHRTVAGPSPASASRNLPASGSRGPSGPASSGAPAPSPLVTSARTQLVTAVHAYPPAAFATSFGAEDMVILDLLVTQDLPVHVFTLDTGRLPDSTHAFMDDVRRHYGVTVHVYAPDAADVEAFTTNHGPNAFYHSQALRKQCCEWRKLRPLARALAGKRLWIAGLRRAQSITRAHVEVLEHDTSKGLAKLCPLAEWTDGDVARYVADYDVPTHPLHAQGFPSIGCAPCTRAVAAGDDPRSGRWWWETPEQRECGLHVAPGGQVVRVHARGTA